VIAPLGFIGAFVLSLVVLVARGLLTDEIKGRVQKRTRAHLDATLDALPAEVRACWEEEWRAELDANLGLPVTAWQLVCGIRRTAAELVGDAAPAAAAQTPGARRPESLRRGSDALNDRLAVLVVRIVRGVLGAGGARVVVPVVLGVVVVSVVVVVVPVVVGVIVVGVIVVVGVTAGNIGAVRAISRRKRNPL
jgi:hypothetical protein